LGVGTLIRRSGVHHNNSLSTLATKVAEKSLFPVTFVAVSGDNWSPFRATFVAVFGDYSFGYNLSPFSATFVASVDRL